MKIACPHCQVALNITPEMLGRKARCPKCQQAFMLPASEQPAAPPPAPESPAAAPPPPPQAPPPQVPAAAMDRSDQRRARAAAAAEGPLKKLAAGGFVAALLCFFLPFFHISCAGTKIMSITGLALVTGGKAQLSDELTSMVKEAGKAAGAPAQPMPTESDQNVDAELLAILAAVAAALGLVFSFGAGKSGSAWGIAAAAGAIVLLLALKVKLDGDLKRDMKEQQATAAQAQPGIKAGEQDVPAELEEAVGQQMMGMIKLEMASGFVLALVLLAAAGALHVTAVVRMGRASPPS